MNAAVTVTPGTPGYIMGIEIRHRGVADKRDLCPVVPDHYLWSSAVTTAGEDPDPWPLPGNSKLA